MSTLVGPIESARTRLHAHTYKPLSPLILRLLSFTLGRARIEPKTERISKIESVPRRRVKWISIESAKGADEGEPTWQRISGICSSSKIPRDTQVKTRPGNEKREMKASRSRKSFAGKLLGVLFRYECMTYRFGIIKSSEKQIVRPSLSPRGRHFVLFFT